MVANRKIEELCEREKRNSSMRVERVKENNLWGERRG
jgi:hypothetical protein